MLNNLKVFGHLPFCMGWMNNLIPLQWRQCHSLTLSQILLKRQKYLLMLKKKWSVLILRVAQECPIVYNLYLITLNLFIFWHKNLGMEAFQLDSTGIQYRTPLLLSHNIYADWENKENGFGLFFSYVVQPTSHLAVSRSQKPAFDNSGVCLAMSQQRVAGYIYLCEKFSSYTDNK